MLTRFRLEVRKKMLNVKKKLFPTGGSLAVLIPKLWLDSKGLQENDFVEMQLNDELTIKTVKEKK